MKFTVIQELKKDFYPTYQAMCERHSFPAFAYPLLPESVFVCYNENKDVLYSIWVYNTDSGLAWMAFPVSNLEIKSEDRIGAFDFLIAEVEKWAKRQSYLFLFTTTGNKSVINALENNEFNIGDTNVDHYYKIIKT
jgi:hypothetical protein